MIRVPTSLLDAARGGEQTDIERLLETVWPDAYRLAVGVLGQSQSAEDAAQEACVVIFRSIGSLRDVSAFNTWFYRIVVREALRQRELREATLVERTEAAYSEDLAESLDLWRALDALPCGLRAVVALHYFEGLSSREIGRVLRVPSATVRFRLMTARRRLQRLLAEPPTPSKGNVYAF